VAERQRHGPAVAPPRPLPAAFEFRSTPADVGTTLAAALRARLPEQSWSALRRLCETGKVRVNGARTLDPATRLGPDALVELDLNRPRPRVEIPGFAIAFEDPHLIVIEKPAGVSSVPFAEKETGTAMDLIRAAWRSDRAHATRQPLYVVHRLDKETSGLLCFAKSKVGERGLHEIFQRHLATRTYLAVCEGAVTPGRIESVLVPDRGDGLRGSADRGGGPDRSTRRSSSGRPGKATQPGQETQRAVTHVEVIERLAGASLCRIRLETGRTHQIRIHLSEQGHPVLGDRVYCRDFLRAGGRPVEVERLMLHAEHLGFLHPAGGQPVACTTPPPPAFAAAVERLRARREPSPRGTSA
jgi:23S rRNA pseudouridine1911/1915/1917 synthase